MLYRTKLSVEEIDRRLQEDCISFRDARLEDEGMLCKRRKHDKFVLRHTWGFQRNPFHRNFYATMTRRQDCTEINGYFFMNTVLMLIYFFLEAYLIGYALFRLLDFIFHKQDWKTLIWVIAIVAFAFLIMGLEVLTRRLSRTSDQKVREYLSERLEMEPVDLKKRKKQA